MSQTKTKSVSPRSNLDAQIAALSEAKWQCCTEAIKALPGQYEYLLKRVKREFAHQQQTDMLKLFEVVGQISEDLNSLSISSTQSPLISPTLTQAILTAEAHIKSAQAAFLQKYQTHHESLSVGKKKAEIDNLNAPIFEIFKILANLSVAAAATYTVNNQFQNPIEEEEVVATIKKPPSLPSYNTNLRSFYGGDIELIEENGQLKRFYVTPKLVSKDSIASAIFDVLQAIRGKYPDFSALYIKINTPSAWPEKQTKDIQVAECVRFLWYSLLEWYINKNTENQIVSVLYAVDKAGFDPGKMRFFDQENKPVNDRRFAISR